MTLRELINQSIDNNSDDFKSLQAYMNSFKEMNYDLEFENESDRQIPDVTSVYVNHETEYITLGEAIK